MDGNAPVQLPGLQDLRGAWRGKVEMKGGGAETPFPGTPANPNTNQVSSVDFDVAGIDWSWGPYQVQSLEAQGNVDAVEGLQLRRVELRSDGAVVKMDGNLFGEVQNAAFAVIDLPAQRLAPIIHHIAGRLCLFGGSSAPTAAAAEHCGDALRLRRRRGLRGATDWKRPRTPQRRTRRYRSHGTRERVRGDHARAYREVPRGGNPRVH